MIILSGLLIIIGGFNMKKILISLLLLLAVVGAASAAIREGHISYANMDNEEYSHFISNIPDKDYKSWWIYYKIDRPEYAPYITSEVEYKSFGSLARMLMALEAGKIDRMEVDLPVAEYFFKLKGNSNKYVPYIITKGVNYYLSMGFKDGSKWFEPFNKTIKAMAKDDTLLRLKAKYIIDANENVKPIKFEKFPKAETVKIAVTGDMPLIDYVAADGTPAGFNTAMLAEIARRLKINIALVNTSSESRAAALASGRADGIFWFLYEKTTDMRSFDKLDGISLTEPYYSWDTLVTIGRKLHK